MKCSGCGKEIFPKELNHWLTEYSANCPNCNHVLHWPKKTKERVMEKKKELAKFSLPKESKDLLITAAEFKQITNGPTYVGACNFLLQTELLKKTITEHYKPSLEAAKKTVAAINGSQKESLAVVEAVRDLLQDKIVKYKTKRIALKAIPGISYRQKISFDVDTKALPRTYFKRVPDLKLIEADLKAGKTVKGVTKDPVNYSLVVKPSVLEK